MFDFTILKASAKVFKAAITPGGTVTSPLSAGASYKHANRSLGISRIFESLTQSCLSGSHISRSHFDIACEETLSSSASACCVSPFSFLCFLMSLPIDNSSSFNSVLFYDMIFIPCSRNLLIFSSAKCKLTAIYRIVQHTLDE